MKRAQAPLDAFGPRSWTRPEVTGYGRVPMSTYLRAARRACRSTATWSFVLRDAARGRARPTTCAGRPTVGRRSRCRAAGRCRASTARSTRTCRCRSPVRRRAVPDDNPTGVYRRTVTVPAAWRGQRIVLHVGGRRVGALRARERRARRHGQGLPPAARVRPHRASSSPARRSSSRSPSCAGRTRPTSRIRTTGTTRVCTAACSSTRRRRCTSPTCTRSPTTTPRPATGALDVRVAVDAPSGRTEGLDRARSRSAGSEPTRRSASSTRRLGRELPPVRRARRGASR